MDRSQKRFASWKVGGVAALAFLALLAATFILGAPGQAAGVGGPEPRVTRETAHQGGAWRVGIATHEDGRKAVAVDYDLEDAKSVRAYAEAVRAIGAGAFMGQERIPALLVFDRPVSVERFTSLMGAANASVRSYQIRTKGARGQRGTVAGVPVPGGPPVTGGPRNVATPTLPPGSGPRNVATPTPRPAGTLIDEEGLARLVARQSATAGEVVHVQGVIEAEIVIDVNGYAALAGQPEVFLVDVMRAVAQRYALAQGVRVPPEAVQLQSPYYFLEEYGLAKR